MLNKIVEKLFDFHEKNLLNLVNSMWSLWSIESTLDFNLSKFLYILFQNKYIFIICVLMRKKIYKYICFFYLNIEETPGLANIQ